MPMDPLSLAVGAVSAIGTTLAALSYRNTVDRQKVKLKVIPAPAWTKPQGDPYVSVEVVNLSPFPVEITELGLKQRDGRRMISYDRMTNDRFLPQRLESRQSVTALFPKSSIDFDMITTGYARTACGYEAHGDSPGLKSIRKNPSLLKPLR